MTRSAAAALLLALSTLPGCMIAVGDGSWENGDSWDEDHWGWVSDVDFSSSRSQIDQLEERIAELEAHAATCAGCCDDD